MFIKLREGYFWDRYTSAVVKVSQITALGGLFITIPALYIFEYLNYQANPLYVLLGLVQFIAYPSMYHLDRATLKRVHTKQNYDVLLILSCLSGLIMCVAPLVGFTVFNVYLVQMIMGCP